MNGEEKEGPLTFQSQKQKPNESTVFLSSLELGVEISAQLPVISLPKVGYSFQGRQEQEIQLRTLNILYFWLRLSELRPKNPFNVIILIQKETQIVSPPPS